MPLIADLQNVTYADKVTGANLYLARLKAEFQAKYQYNILGQEDFLFADVAGATTYNTDNFNALKSFRTNELLSVQRIEASSADANSKLKQTAVAGVNFVNNALGRVSGILDKAKPADGDSESIATSISALADHLLESVNKYAEAVNNGSVEAKDSGFVTAAKTARLSLLQLSIKIRPLLISDNQLFNKDIYNLGSKLNDILDALNTISAGGASASASSSSSSSSSVNVVV